MLPISTSEFYRADGRLDHSTLISRIALGFTAVSTPNNNVALLGDPCIAGRDGVRSSAASGALPIGDHIGLPEVLQVMGGDPATTGADDPQMPALEYRSLVLGMGLSVSGMPSRSTRTEREPVGR